jgi:hypothetical protein
MSSILEHHYVYYSYEEWGRGYFGSRTCECLPEKDTEYFGSFSDKTFNPTQKIILKGDYASREEAYKDEIILHDYYDVVKNLHFANKAKQTSIGFSTLGTSFSKEIKEKISKGHIGLKLSEETKNKISKAHTGKIVSEETKQKLRNINKGRYIGDRNAMFGRFGPEHPRFGGTHSDEAKEKISKACRERFLNADHPWKGKTHSEETKRKMSESIKKLLQKTSSPCSGTKWYNNGEKSIRIRGPAPPGFVLGRLRKFN